ncbi:MAG: biotin-dependent carboxyltransferase family protein [Pseudomonadota bacterium]
MTGTLRILSAGPAMTVQDLGREGFLAHGLTRGGAADVLALYEGAALLGQSPELAALEMVGMGGTFKTDKDTMIALTGARMTAKIDNAPLIWNASHLLPAGAKLSIGGAVEGTYGYLSVAGGIDVAKTMGARSSHLTAGVGRLLRPDETLPLTKAVSGKAASFIVPEGRMAGGTIRVVPSIQTDQFTRETLDRFAKTEFRRDPRGNRQGVRMASDGDGFFVDGGLSIVSEIIIEGDIQITGDGAPYVLMCECQTTGGYPRIGTVLPSDLPRVAQAPVGASLRFQFVTLEEARQIEQRARADRKALAGRVEPLVRDPSDIPDLLSYQLVGGVVSATADPFTHQKEISQ